MAKASSYGKMAPSTMATGATVALMAPVPSTTRMETSTLAFSRKTRPMALAFTPTAQASSISAIGSIMTNMEMELRNLKMGPSILEPLKQARKRDKVS